MCRARGRHRQPRLSDRVRFEIQEQELASYRRAADYLNLLTSTWFVCSMNSASTAARRMGTCWRLMRDLRVPVVSTLHTVLQTPNDDQLRVMQKLCELSSRVVVMSGMSQFPH